MKDAITGILAGAIVYVLMLFCAEAGDMQKAWGSFGREIPIRGTKQLDERRYGPR